MSLADSMSHLSAAWPEHPVMVMIGIQGRKQNAHVLFLLAPNLLLSHWSMCHMAKSMVNVKGIIVLMWPWKGLKMQLLLQASIVHSLASWPPSLMPILLFSIFSTPILNSFSVFRPQLNGFLQKTVDTPDWVIVVQRQVLSDSL